ncbi:unnamed protein product, partial [marine sediment metagenome]
TIDDERDEIEDLIESGELEEAGDMIDDLESERS